MAIRGHTLGPNPISCVFGPVVLWRGHGSPALMESPLQLVKDKGLAVKQDTHVVLSQLKSSLHIPDQLQAGGQMSE